MAKVLTMSTVEDIETAKAVFVTRALYISDYTGYLIDGREALSAVGLSDYFTSDYERYTIDMTRLKKIIGDSFTVRLTKGRTPTQRPGDVRDQAYRLLTDWYQGITDEEWAAVPVSDKIVDTDAVGKLYGIRGTLPPAGNDEVTQTWRDLTVGILKWADDRGLCGTVEQLLSTIGMDVFFPARTVNVTVAWEGQTFELQQVPANRQGKPTPRDLQVLLKQKITADSITVVSTVATSV
jgi:hypothetical protein